MVSESRGLNTPRDVRNILRYQKLLQLSKDPPSDDLRYDLVPFGRICRGFAGRSISDVPAFLSRLPAARYAPLALISERGRLNTTRADTVALRDFAGRPGKPRQAATERGAPRHDKPHRCITPRALTPLDLHHPAFSEAQGEAAIFQSNLVNDDIPEIQLNETFLIRSEGRKIALVQ